MIQKVKDAPKKFSLTEFEFINNRVNQTLYNLKDPVIDEFYQRALRMSSGQAYSSDKNLRLQLVSVVSRHVGKYPDRNLIITRGAANILWGPLSNFEGNYNCLYIPAPPVTISSTSVPKEGLHLIEVQIRRDVDAVKDIGYGSIEQFRGREYKIKPEDGIKHIIVGEETVDISSIYNGESGKETASILQQFVKQFRPSSLLYVAEGLDIVRITKEYAAYKEEEIEVMSTLVDTKNGATHRTLPRDRLIMVACDESIPVEFGSFGSAYKYDKLM